MPRAALRGAGDSESDEEGLPELYRRRKHGSKAAQAASSSQPEPPAAADDADSGEEGAAAATGDGGVRDGGEAAGERELAVGAEGVVAAPAPGSLVVQLEGELRELAGGSGGEAGGEGSALLQVRGRRGSGGCGLRHAFGRLRQWARQHAARGKGGSGGGSSPWRDGAGWGA
jgi:hypothetical protein